MPNNQTNSSGRGGQRKGAGRKPGSATRRTREIADRAAEDGITPLEFMLQVMRSDIEEPARRLDAAKSAAPYIHPRLAAMEVSGPDGAPLQPPVIQFVRDADPAK